MNLKYGLINLYRFFVALIIIYVIYSACIVSYSIYKNLRIPQVLKAQIFSSSEKRGKTIALMVPDRAGEVQQAEMIMKVAEKKGIAVYSYIFNDNYLKIFLPAKYLNSLIIYILNWLLRPDLHFAISYHINFYLPSPKIMYMSVPEQYFITKYPDYPEVRDYDNFIDINLMNSKGGWLHKVLNKRVNSKLGIIGVPENLYKTSARQKLLYYGSLWGRGTNDILGALQELIKQDYMYVIEDSNITFDEKYLPKLAARASSFDSLEDRLNQYGIGLCIHSRFHNEAAIPSSRIFEIISSGAIAISDKNPFVIKYFGENVLYFDQTLSQEEIFSQINAHVKWIRSHPQEAEIMARRAHQIVMDNFTTEKFMEVLLNEN